MCTCQPVNIAACNFALCPAFTILVSASRSHLQPQCCRTACLKRGTATSTATDAAAHGVHAMNTSLLALTLTAAVRLCQAQNNRLAFLLHVGLTLILALRLLGLLLVVLDEECDKEASKANQANAQEQVEEHLHSIVANCSCWCVCDAFAPKLAACAFMPALPSWQPVVSMQPAPCLMQATTQAARTKPPCQQHHRWQQLFFFFFFFLVFFFGTIAGAHGVHTSMQTREPRLRTGAKQCSYTCKDSRGPCAPQKCRQA